MELSDNIIEKIRKNGPISFRDFMEMSLYFPGAGYYTSPGNKIGKTGDYYTSPHVSSLFGHMIGKQLEEMWNHLEKKSFVVIEYGGGMGLLCRDILEYCKNNSEFYDQIEYYIIEKNPVAPENKDSNLQVNGIINKKIKWIESIGELGEINGCILSNELVDNFPVHRVVMQDELMEIFVDYNNKFVELLKPASYTLRNYLAELNIILPRGYCTEINLQAIVWIEEIASTLKKGFVLTIDYGYSSSEYYSSQRNQGTLLCYYNHTINDSPYRNIGKQDITSHVNFSALHHWGLKYGLEYCGYTNQSQFLLALGLTGYLKNIEANEKGSAAGNQDKTLLIHTLLMEMGSKFKVLIQQKGLYKPGLSGIVFSRRNL